MTYCVDDTIAAIASAPGGAVRGIIRMSGPRTLFCLSCCFHPADQTDLTQVRQARVVTGTIQLADPIGDLPCELYFWPHARSYTRQISAELHTLGSPPLLDAALQTLCQHGVRLAHPGEFTMRAFLAGRLDLTQAEAVLGVIDAQDARTLEVALSQLAGGLAGPLHQLRSDLIDLLADLEASLDFVDEDLEFVSAHETSRRLYAAIEVIQQVLHQIHSRGLATREPRVVLRGWPNVGKSSLINALAGDDVAIVSHEAGTTRDYVTRGFQWSGVTGLLVDTAGVEELRPLDPLSIEAQRAGQSQHRQADLELLCLDATRALNDWERRQLAASPATTRLVVWTKIDKGLPSKPLVPAEVETSACSGQGIEQLRSRIRDLLIATSTPDSLVVASTSQRCEHSLVAAAECVQRANK